MPGEIHEEHPFVDPEEQRDPIRRFRGRLGSPVTVVTAGETENRAGLTISSLVVAGDADLGWVHFVLGPESYLWDAIRRTGRFVVHVLEASQRAVSDQFAGARPSPGGPFAGLEVEDSQFGPVLAGCRTRAACSLDGAAERENHLVVTGRIESVEVHDLTAPLEWFRGSYRELEAR